MDKTCLRCHVGLLLLLRIMISSCCSRRRVTAAVMDPHTRTSARHAASPDSLLYRLCRAERRGKPCRSLLVKVVSTCGANANANACAAPPWGAMSASALRLGDPKPARAVFLKHMQNVWATRVCPKFICAEREWLSVRIATRGPRRVQVPGKSAALTRDPGIGCFACASRSALAPCGRARAMRT